MWISYAWNQWIGKCFHSNSSLSWYSWWLFFCQKCVTTNITNGTWTPIMSDANRITDSISLYSVDELHSPVSILVCTIQFYVMHTTYHVSNPNNGNHGLRISHSHGPGFLPNKGYQAFPDGQYIGHFIQYAMRKATKRKGNSLPFDRIFRNDTRMNSGILAIYHRVTDIGRGMPTWNRADVRCGEMRIQLFEAGRQGDYDWRVRSLRNYLLSS